MEEADHLCQHVAFLVKGHIVANGTPRDLKLAYGERLMDVTLISCPASQEQSPTLTERTLSMDNPADQAQLAQWLAQGTVKAIHSSRQAKAPRMPWALSSHPALMLV